DALSVNPATVRTALHRLGVHTPKGPRTSSELAAQIISLHEAGKSGRDISRELNVTRAHVRMILLRNKAYEPRIPSPVLIPTDEQKIEIITQFKSGLGAVQVSSLLQLPLNSVKFVLRHAGV